GADTVNVNGTGAGSTTTLNGGTGNDVVNVRAIGAPVTVNGGDDADTINVTNGGKVSGIAALLTVGGDGGTDVLNIDDTADATARTGTLTSNTVTGLGMAGSIAYGTFETLNIGLGTKADSFTIASTHAALTNLRTNDGADAVLVQ